MARWLIAFLLLLAPSVAHAQRGPLERQNNLSDVDSAATALSNIGGNNASNLSTGTLPAARLPASGVTPGTFGSATTAPQITVDASGRITAAGNVAISGGGSAAIFSPQGRLTLTSGSPVMSADVVGATTIYYDDYSGNAVPIYNGTASVMYPITGGEISLALNATDEPAGSLYDVFGISVSGTLTLCAGPAWTSTTARADAIGIAATGYWTNSVSLPHCYAGATDEGPVSAEEGTYLGTFYANAAGAVTMQFQPAAVAGGSGCMMGLSNAYNQVPVSCIERNSATWTYSQSTWRVADGSAANGVTFVSGLVSGNAAATYQVEGEMNGVGTSIEIGIDFDNTTATPLAMDVEATGASTVDYRTLHVFAVLPSPIGLHSAYAMEWVYAPGANPAFDPSSTSAPYFLVLRMEM